MSSKVFEKGVRDPITTSRKKRAEPEWENLNRSEIKVFIKMLKKSGKAKDLEIIKYIKELKKW